MTSIVLDFSLIEWNILKRTLIIMLSEPVSNGNRVIDITVTSSKFISDLEDCKFLLQKASLWTAVIRLWLLIYHQWPPAVVLKCLIWHCLVFQAVSFAVSVAWNVSCCWASGGYLISPTINFVGNREGLFTYPLI